MPTPLLATKLYIPPPRPGAVPRLRLIARLNAGLQRKLTLISAPAGFGKTSLLSAWLSRKDEDRRQKDETLPPSAFHFLPAKVAWLALDAADSEPTRFLTYLVAALQAIDPALGAGVAAALESPQPPPAEALLTTLLNDIAGLPHHGVLVLDDYHLVDARPIDAALAFLLEHLPPQLHLAITTREDPQLPLARLRARGQLTELRAADLRFTHAEAAEFLTRSAGLSLAATEIAALERRTEGWIAGLQLAALSLHERTDVAQFVQAFSGDNRYIVDYLVEEVLQRQPAHVRSFLLQTSMLDRLSGPLCDYVLGIENEESRMRYDDRSSASSILNSQFILEELERANLFLVPLDDTRHWFRYHHLFADVLAARMLQEQPAQLPILHQRASAWYAEHGLPAEAIRHALAAGDFDRAAELIELAWPAMDRRFQAAAWLGWARALPAALVSARPVLATAYAWALLNGGELEAAAARLAEAERWLSPTAAPGQPLAAPVIVDEAQFQALPASIATARAYMAQARGDIPGSVRHGRQALELLPMDDHLRRGPAAALLGLAHWARGDLETAHLTLAQAMADFQKAGILSFALSGTYGLADIRAVQGRLHDAVATYTQALRFALAQGEPPLSGTAELYLGLGELAREQGDLAAAHEHMRRSEDLGERAALPDWRYRFCRGQALLCASEGDLAGALERLEQAERHYRPTPVPDVRPLAAWKARVWLAQGRLGEARRWAQACGLSANDELSFLHEFEHITLARLLLAEHAAAGDEQSLHEGLRLLDRLLHAADAGGRQGSAIEISLLQALAHQAQGAPAPALAALARALRLAEPAGYVRLFADEGPPLARLLAVARAQSILPGYCARLLAAFAGEPAVGSRQPPSILPTADCRLPTASSKPEPLSERELEVLRLLGSELSGPEIADRLMVSLNTMRTHTKNIYSKLGVSGRRAAVRRAQELGLM